MKRIFFGALMFLGLILSPGFLSNPAVASEVFSVNDVFVDVTAENVTSARAQAMRDAQGRALETMLKRLTLREDHPLLPWVEPNDRAQYIQNFSVRGEKTSAVRYLASFDFVFKPDAIRSLLQSRALNFAETISKPVLIIPLLEDGARQTIWDAPNPWSDAWRNIQARAGLVPLALPLGDLADISGLSAQQANQNDAGPILNMANRYDVNEAVVAKAVVAGRDLADNPNDVDLVITRFTTAGQQRNTVLGLSAAENETTEDFLLRVAGEVQNAVEEDWKRANLLQFGVGDVLPVNLSIANLKEWLNVKNRLGNVAVIEKIELALLSRDTVQLNLHYIGNLNQLIGSLKQVDLDLTVSQERWFLVNTGPQAS